MPYDIASRFRISKFVMFNVVESAEKWPPTMKELASGLGRTDATSKVTVGV
jgi:hypothetical protein